MTRIDKFNNSFQAFMETFSLEEWNLTKNNPSHTGSVHIFHLNIPFTYRVITPQAIDGNLELHESHKTQNRPMHDEFKLKFDEYFNPYNQSSMNCVKINEHMINEAQEYHVDIYLLLANGKPLPFPTPLNDETRFRRLETQNRQLMSRLDTYMRESASVREFWLERIVQESNLRIKMKRKWQKDKVKLMNQNARHVNRMVDTIRKYYAQQEQTENCPVCFEPIEANKLYISGCCHYLCDACANHVIQVNNKCPICRDELYSATDGENVTPNTNRFPFPNVNNLQIEPIVIDLNQGEVEMEFP